MKLNFYSKVVILLFTVLPHCFATTAAALLKEESPSVQAGRLFITQENDTRCGEYNGIPEKEIGTPSQFARVEPHTSKINAFISDATKVKKDEAASDEMIAIIVIAAIDEEITHHNDSSRPAVSRIEEELNKLDKGDELYNHFTALFLIKKVAQSYVAGRTNIFNSINFNEIANNADSISDTNGKSLYEQLFAINSKITKKVFTDCLTITYGKHERGIVKVKAKIEREEQKRIIADAAVTAADLKAKELKDKEDAEKARLAQVEKDRLAQVEKDRLAQEEKDRLAQVEKDRLAQEEKDRLAQVEKDRLAQEEKDRLAQEEKDRLAQVEKDRLAQEEKDRLAQVEKDRLAQEEKDRLAQVEKDRLAQVEKDRLAQEEKDRLAALTAGTPVTTAAPTGTVINPAVVVIDPTSSTATPVVPESEEDKRNKAANMIQDLAKRKKSKKAAALTAGTPVTTTAPTGPVINPAVVVIDPTSSTATPVVGDPADIHYSTATPVGAVIESEEDKLKREATEKLAKDLAAAQAIVNEGEPAAPQMPQGKNGKFRTNYTEKTLPQALKNKKPTGKRMPTYVSEINTNNGELNKAIDAYYLKKSAYDGAKRFVNTAAK